ncbi:WHG domain-containing protein [Streptomyces sp. 8N616]|uniref:WHG domain-containing protein n=1 Tax=Streptomyces sp. 8N616 TaxID=3457414 RepID=UPI003FD0D65F
MADQPKRGPGPFHGPGPRRALVAVAVVGRGRAWPNDALPPAAVALALRIWGHLHGLVSLEIYGHLLTQTLDPDKLYREELAQLVGSLGLATHH